MNNETSFYCSLFTLIGNDKNKYCTKTTYLLKICNFHCLNNVIKHQIFQNKVIDLLLHILLLLQEDQRILDLLIMLFHHAMHK